MGKEHCQKPISTTGNERGLEYMQSVIKLRTVSGGRVSGHTSPGSRPRPVLGTTAESDPWRRFFEDDAEKQDARRLSG